MDNINNSGQHNPEPIYSNIPVVPQRIEAVVPNRTQSQNDFEAGTSSRNYYKNSFEYTKTDEINKHASNRGKEFNSTVTQDEMFSKMEEMNISSPKLHKNEDTFLGRYFKVSSNQKYFSDNIYARNSQSFDFPIPKEEDVSLEERSKIASSKPKYYQDNIYASNQKFEFPVPKKEERPKVSSNPKYYQDNIYAPNSEESNPGIYLKTKDSTSEQTSKISSTPKFHQDNNSAAVRPPKNGLKSHNSDDLIYENVASNTTQKSSKTFSKEDIYVRTTHARLTSEFKFPNVDTSGKRAEKAISVLLKDRTEIKLDEKFDRKIGNSGNFDNFDGNVRDSKFSLQSYDSFDFDLEENEEPIHPVMYTDEFKNDSLILCSRGNITLAKALTFMDKYKMVSWFQLMKLMQLNIIHTMDASQLTLQNKKFALILAEWSFYKTMKMFDSHVVSKLVIALSRNDYKKLFGHLNDVIKCSEDFLKDLEECWQRNPLLPDFFDVVCANLQSRFCCYVQFCGSQPVFETTLSDLLCSTTNHPFYDILNTIHKDPKSQGLHLHGYLLKPYKKIRDFPSLILNVMVTLSADDLEYCQCQKALSLLQNLLEKCALAETQTKERMLVHEINKKLEFSKNMSLKSLTNIETRRFVHSGPVDLIEMNTSIFKKQKHIVKPVHLFLFNDLLVVTRKSSDAKYVVLTYSYLIYIEISKETFFAREIYETLNEERILFLMMQENHEKQPLELLLSFETYTDKIRWMEALDPDDSVIANLDVNSNVSFEVVVERNYKAKQSDELSLWLRNKIIVYRTYYDGWYFGQRITDRRFGWFPSTHVQQTNR